MACVVNACINAQFLIDEYWFHFPVARWITVMGSQHLTSEDLDNSLLTEWPIQKTYYSFTGQERNKQKKVKSWTDAQNSNGDKCD